jgi:hypothetical protein
MPGRGCVSADTHGHSSNPARLQVRIGIAFEEEQRRRSRGNEQDTNTHPLHPSPPGRAWVTQSTQTAGVGKTVRQGWMLRESGPLRPVPLAAPLGGQPQQRFAEDHETRGQRAPPRPEQT